MAYSIFFCDDDMEAVRLFVPEIRNAFHQYDPDVQISAFTDPHALLSALSDHCTCDLLIVDIDMPRMSGIDLCERLMESGTEIPVVFLSNMEDRVYETFAFPTAFFIRKRFFHDEIHKAAKKVFQSTVCDSVVFSNGIRNYRVSVSDILYLEIINQTLHIHLKDNEISLRFRMDEAQRMLEPYGFVRVHKGYLVSIHKISCLQREKLILADGTEIPVSRRRYRDIRDRFFQYSMNDFIHGDNV